MLCAVFEAIILQRIDFTSKIRIKNKYYSDDNLIGLTH